MRYKQRINSDRRSERVTDWQLCATSSRADLSSGPLIKHCYRLSIVRRWRTRMMMKRHRRAIQVIRRIILPVSASSRNFTGVIPDSTDSPQHMVVAAALATATAEAQAAAQAKQAERTAKPRIFSSRIANVTVHAMSNGCVEALRTTIFRRFPWVCRFRSSVARFRRLTPWYARSRHYTHTGGQWSHWGKGGRPGHDLGNGMFAFPFAPTSRNIAGRRGSHTKAFN